MHRNHSIIQHCASCVLLMKQLGAGRRMDNGYGYHIISEAQERVDTLRMSFYQQNSKQAESKTALLPCSVSQSNVGAGAWRQARGGGGCVLTPNLLVCSHPESGCTGNMMRTHPYLHGHLQTWGEIHVLFSEFIRYVKYLFSFPDGVWVRVPVLPVRTCLLVCSVTSVCTAAGSSALRWRVGTKHHKYSRY